MPKDIVLCVDDEAIVLRACSIAIAKAGYRVAVAENANAGFEAFLELHDQICLVLCDAVMPGKEDGLDLARRILEIAADTKVLMMTGYSETSAKISGRSLPIIRKPFLPEDLTTRIRMMLRGDECAAEPPSHQWNG